MLLDPSGLDMRFLCHQLRKPAIAPDFLALSYSQLTLGHGSIAGTQYYLHLTAELFPEVTERANKAFADIIPPRNPS